MSTMKRDRKQLPPGRRAARVVVWTAFVLILIFRFAIFRDQPPPVRVPGPPPGGPWQQRDARFRRPPTLIQSPVAVVPNDLPRLQITISPEDTETLRAYYWNGWRSRQQERAEVLATVTEGETVYTNVAIHLKGSAGSFRPFDDKPALTLNFSKHSAGQRFHGYSKFSLNNSVQDPTFLCEAICRELCNAAGVPAPKAEWATVLINGRDLGLYVLIEGYNKEFLRHHFKNVKGNLYDGGFCQEVTAKLSVNSGEHPDDRSDLQRLVAAASDPASETRWTRLSQVLDMDRFLTLMAMEVAMCHWDGYGLNRNNYRVFHNLETDKMVFMPHGMDQMFDWPPQHRFPTDGSIQPLMRGLVASAVLGTTEGSRQYLEHLRAVETNVFQEDKVLDRVRQLQQRIRPTLAAYGENLAETHDAAVASLCSRIHRRIQSIAEQLGQTTDPIQFDRSGKAALTNWVYQSSIPGQSRKLDKVEEDGKTLLPMLAGNGGGTGSWRTHVLLASGQYILEGRVKVSSSAIGSRVTLRVSGSRPEPQVAAGTDWIPLSFPFHVDAAQAEVWLVCEFRGNRGEAWFDLDSLHLERQ